MSDYTGLVKKLRYDSLLVIEPLCSELVEAADAIEHLTKAVAHYAEQAKEQEVKRGRWKPFDLSYGRSVYYCTVCEHSAVVPTVLDKPIFNYCPNCGAQMEGTE